MKDLDVAEISPLKLKERRVFKGHSSKVASLAWSKDSKTILTAGQDRMLIVSLGSGNNDLMTLFSYGML